MPIYNLIENSKNYSKTSDTLWNYYKDVLVDPITNSESFKYFLNTFKSQTGVTFRINIKMFRGND